MADDISDFTRSMGIATSGLRAQAGRMRVISENIANADSTAPTAGGDPYRRKVPTFSSRSTARSTRRSSRSARSRPIIRLSAPNTSPPIRPRTQTGYVKYPNVNPLVEMTDMRDAQRSYEANLNIISATRRMIQRTLDILKT